LRVVVNPGRFVEGGRKDELRWRRRGKSIVVFEFLTVQLSSGWRRVVVLVGWTCSGSWEE
jgi:hypothetical protein